MGEKILFILAFSCMAVCGSALPLDELYILDIVHYNDFHARYEETSVESGICRTNDASCLGGFARLYHEVHVLFEEKPEAILLNAGDSFRGTYWDTLFQWNLMQQFMNLLPHDAHTLGNHEFDHGIDGLVLYLLALKSPVVVANIDTSKEPSLQGLIQPHIVIERRGKKIGIIGLITVDTMEVTTPGDVVVSDPGAATLREAQILTDMGIDIIVVLSHCGLDVDLELARDYGHLVDVIIGGHSHSLLWNEEVSPSGEEISGNYPIIIENGVDESHKTLVVQAGAHTKYMGNLTIYFDSLGRYVEWEGGPIFLNRSIPEDPEILAMLAPYAELVHKAEKVTVGETVVAMNAEDCSLGECAIGDALVDAQIEYAKANYRSDLDHLAFRLRERVSYSIPEGVITEGIVFELLSHDDKMVTYELQGKYVLEALERSITGNSLSEPYAGDWTLQVAGLKVTYDISKEEGQRVASVILTSGENLDPEAFYQVTTSTHLARGSEGYSVIKENKRNEQFIGREQDMFRKYIKTYSPLNVTLDGRIQLLF